jgi:4'-phosphopantetheinyl transferase
MVKITNSSEGKPQLNAGEHSHPLPFNLSHTEGLCIIAVSRDFEVGVDVEKVHELKELSSLARTYFSNDEWAMWSQENDAGKLNGFFDYWCAKEAILKAVGCGLAIHPGQINVIEAQKGRPLRGIQENGFFFEFRDYIIDPLPLEDGYKGWLAVFGDPAKVSCNSLSPQVLADLLVSLSEGRNVEK